MRFRPVANSIVAIRVIALKGGRLRFGCRVHAGVRLIREEKAPAGSMHVGVRDSMDTWYPLPNEMARAGEGQCPRLLETLCQAVCWCCTAAQTALGFPATLLLALLTAEQ